MAAISLNATIASITGITSQGTALGISTIQTSCATMVAARHIEEGVNTVVPRLTAMIPSATLQPLVYDSQKLEHPSVEAGERSACCRGREESE